MQPVGARTAATVAGGLVAIVVAAVFCVRTVPDRVISLLGGPAGGVERWGGVRVTYEPPTGGSEIRDYPGVAIDDVSVASLVDVLEAGGLSMKLALETDWAVDLAADSSLVIRDERDLRDDERSSADPRARLESDYWRSDDGSVHRTFFLHASTREALDAAILDARRRGVTLPPNTQIAYEVLEPRHASAKPSVRAYLLASEVLIDGTMIESAVGAFDPNTNRPIVLLDFTREGGNRFCDLTRTITGQKLAMLLGGEVRSAPIINGAICGGRASITMGGSDAERQVRERDMIVGVLSHGALPPGGKVRDLVRLEPANTAMQTLLGRLLLGLLAGLGAALLTFLVVSRARPSVAKAHGFTGAFPWRRLSITGLAPLALIVGKRITIPGVNDVELAHVMRGGDLEVSSVIALGLAPILLAYGLVELVALTVPALRWRRHDPAGRLGLGRVTAIVAILLALVHGYVVARYLEGSNAFIDLVDLPGLKFQLLATISLVAGTLLLAVIAGAISEHGLGNGYGVLMASAIALDLVPNTDLVKPFTAPFALGVVTFASIVVAASCVLRWRIGDGQQPALRVPSSGLAPLVDSGAVVSLILTLTGLAANATLFDVLIWSNVLHDWKVRLALVAVTLPIWAWIFARPSVLERVALQAGIERATRSTWLRALAVSALLVLGSAMIALAAPLDTSLHMFVNPVSALVVAAVLLDVIADARARRTELAIAAVIHQPQDLGVIEHALAEAQLPYHLHASHLRTLFAFFGPWAPIHVLVEPDRAIEARVKLDEILRGARTKVPEARAR